MRYMLLITTPESHYATMSEAEMGRLMGAYNSFTEELQAAGAYHSADRLQPVATATTVRVRNGEATTVDGPFAETKEQLGGFYTIDVPNLDDAIAWAKKVPSATYGSIEIRPVWDDCAEDS